MRALSRHWNPNNLPALFSEHIEPNPLPSPRLKQRNRDFLLGETLSAKCIRIGSALVSHLKKSGLVNLAHAADVILRDKAVGTVAIPDPKHALNTPDGFCQLTDDLSISTLMDIYARGMYVESGVTDASLWAPNQRRIIDLTTYESAKRRAFKGSFTCDTNTDYVISRCDEARDIQHSARLLHAFAQMADAGIAHSCEIRDENGTLNGGLFGIVTGRIFVVHGIFARNIAEQTLLIDQLLNQLLAKKFILVDFTPVASLSHADIQDMSRSDFTLCASTHQANLHIGRWTNSETLPQTKTSVAYEGRMAA
eukprot:gene6559-6628_t